MAESNSIALEIYSILEGKIRRTLVLNGEETVPIFVSRVYDSYVRAFCYSIEYVEDGNPLPDFKGVWLNSLSMVLARPTRRRERFTFSDFNIIFDSVIDSGHLITPLYFNQLIDLSSNKEIRPGAVIRIRIDDFIRLRLGQYETTPDSLRISQVETRHFRRFCLEVSHSNG